MTGKVRVNPADILCLFTYKHGERKKKISEFLLCLIAQQQQKVSWQRLRQPAPAGSSPHHMSAQTLMTPLNKPHGSLDTLQGLCMLFYTSNQK